MAHPSTDETAGADVVRRAVVITASTRGAARALTDTSGPTIVEALRDLGFDARGPVVASDGEPVFEALREAMRQPVDLIITTGGTGHTPTDLTPEMTRRVIDRESPGIAEAVRARGVQNGVPGAILSRGIAGIAGSTLIINLPGSLGGVKDGMAALAPVLMHAIDQIHGGDHPSA